MSQHIYPNRFEVGRKQRHVELQFQTKKYPVDAMVAYFPEPVEGFELKRNPDTRGFELHFDDQLTERTELVVILGGGTTSRETIVLEPEGGSSASVDSEDEDIGKDGDEDDVTD